MGKVKAESLLTGSADKTKTKEEVKSTESEHTDSQPFGDKAVVLMSSGISSLYSLIWASRSFKYPETITLEYKQSHSIECQSANFLSDYFDALHKLVFLRDTDYGFLLDGCSGTNLNHMFILISAVMYAVVEKDVRNIVCGISDKDFVDSIDVLINKALKNDTKRFKVLFPCYGLSKARTISLILESHRKAEEMLSYTVSCDSETNYMCNKCDKCRDRKDAFYSVGIADPLLGRLKK